MKNNQSKYFHDAYFKKISQLMRDERFEEAIIEFENYTNIYPEDLNGYIYYAICYMKTGQFKTAEKILENIIITKGVSEYSKQHLELIKINLLSCQERYSEAYELMQKNTNTFINNGWAYQADLLFLKKQLGILDESDYKIAENSYLLSQVVSYDEASAISHIEKHLYIDENEEQAEFVEGFPMHDIFDKLKKMLPLEDKIYDGGVANKYTFKYISNGHVGSKLVDYIRVITIKDSNEIITMYPFENKGRRPCIDLTPIVEKQPKQKRLSQIEKFNQRYGSK